MAKRIKPITRIVRIEAEISRMIGEVFEKQGGWTGLDECWVPWVDILETKDAIVVEIELPGVREDDITLLLHTNRFEIKGVKRDSPPRESANFYRLEREYGPFRRVVFLPASIITEDARAVLENGILTLTMEKYRKRKDDEVVMKIQKKDDQ
jgi:HSP20 family protein